MSGRPVRPRKRFGQHFLTDEHVLARLERAIAPARDDRVLEIGPGRGALTALLAPALERLTAIEIDRDLAARLRQSFRNLELIEGDVLRTDLAALVGDGGWRLVGNLPYNISTPLLLALVPLAPKLVDVHVMLQREVAERLAAAPGSKQYGRLTVMLGAAFAVESLFDVAPASFTPPPRVWSSVVRLTPGSDVPAPRAPDLFADVVRRAFGARRKRLDNALRYHAVDWARVGVDPALRAEQVPVTDYVRIADTIAERGADSE